MNYKSNYRSSFTLEVFFLLSYTDLFYITEKMGSIKEKKKTNLTSLTLKTSAIGKTLLRDEKRSHTLDAYIGKPHI